MADITSIQLPKATRDKLRKYGAKGQTWGDIIENLMARVEYEAFMDQQYARLAERDAFVPLEEA